MFSSTTCLLVSMWSQKKQLILFCPCLELLYPAEKRTLPVFAAAVEALEQLLLMRFIYDSKQKFNVNLERLSAKVNGKVDKSLLAEAEVLFCSYESYPQQARNCSLGKTAQFWILYLDLMRMQHVIQTAVQENDFDARLAAWDYFMPLYFAFNKTNYARYGSFYVEILKSIEEKYPRNEKSWIICAGTR